MAHGDLAQTAALLGAVAAVLVLVPRSRVALVAGFGLIALAEAGLAVALIPRSDFERLGHPLPAAGLVLMLAVLAAGTFGLLRWPAVVPVVLGLAAPFRLPVDLGSQHAFLLLPLYGVLAATVLALIVRAVRGPVPAVAPLLAIPLAAFVALVAVSLLWAKDLQQGSIELAFFILPFVALAAVIARAPVAWWLARALCVAVVALACIFSAIGLWQEWTRTVFYAQDLRVANTYASFFRVTSVFKDPSIYGRELVLAIALLLVALWLGKVRIWVAALLVALIFAGLYFSYSQSSMAVLFATALAISLVLADRTSRFILGGAAVAALLAAGLVAFSVARDHSLRHATSGRSRLVTITATVIRNHPVIGVGIGSQPVASRAEAKTSLGARKDASHTTPLTVAAELGALGAALYLVLLAAATRLLWLAVRRRRALGLGLATTFYVLLLHSLFYSGFFEDPVMWGTLGLAAAVVALPAEAPAEEANPVAVPASSPVPAPQEGV